MTDTFQVEKLQHRFLCLLPHDPQCKLCHAPVHGIGGALVNALRKLQTPTPSFPLKWEGEWSVFMKRETEKRLDKQRRLVAYLDGLQAKVNALRELQSASGKSCRR